MFSHYGIMWYYQQQNHDIKDICSVSSFSGPSLHREDYLNFRYGSLIKLPEHYELYNVH